MNFLIAKSQYFLTIVILFLGYSVATAETPDFKPFSGQTYKSTTSLCANLDNCVTEYEIFSVVYPECYDCGVFYFVIERYNDNSYFIANMQCDISFELTAPSNFDDYYKDIVCKSDNRRTGEVLESIYHYKEDGDEEHYTVKEN